MLKALELVGFKSFADRTRFEFPPGITAVVGPNGSGKSNVVDAVKWVLGEQSVKSLRGKEMADVIFNGSSTRPPLNTAETTLTLDNAARLLPIDTPEVHITRRVYRNGESEYLINREPCRRRDVRELFSGTGVATEAYSVIEQGKVDVLLQSSPRDRRAIFEEAAGISRFKAKKVEALRRLERVDQNLLRLSDIVEEVDNRLRSVRKQASKARRYREYIDRLQELRTQVGLADWRKLSAELEATEREVQKMHDERAASLARAESLEAEALEHETLTADTDEAIRASESRVAENREQIAAHEARIEHERARLRDVELEASRHRSSARGMSVRAEDVVQQLDRTAQEIGEAQSQRQQIVDQLAQEQNAAGELAQQLEALRADAARSREAYLEQVRIAAALGTEISTLTARRQTLVATVERGTKRAAEFRTEHEELMQELAELRRQQRDLQRAVDLRAGEAAEAQGRLSAYREQLTTRQQELAEVERKLAATAERVAVLDELDRRHEGIGAGARALLESCREDGSGTWRAVRGMVADVIRATSELAPLVDIALAERAQYFVVETEADVRRLIAEHGKDLEGRVGFIPLDLAGSETPDAAASALDGREGVIGRADQLVQADSRLKPALARLLGRTWFVRDLETALRIRPELPAGGCAVTAAGELVDSQGIVCVGPKPGSSGVVSRRSELRDLRREVADLERGAARSGAEVVRLSGQVDAQERSVAALADAHRRAHEALADGRLHVQAAVDREKRLADSITECEEQTRVASADLTKVEAEVAVAQSAQAANQERLTVLETAAKDSERQTLELERRRQQQDQAIVASRVELAKSDERLASLQALGAQLQRDRDERRRGVDDVRHLLAQAEARARQATWSILQAESRVAELYLHKERFAAETVVLVNRREQHRSQRSALVTAAQQVRAAARELDERLHGLELSAGETRLARSGLVERLRDDYGIDLAALPEPATAEQEKERAEIDQEIAELRRKIAGIGNVNLEALDELAGLEERHTQLEGQHSDLSKARQSLMEIINRINTDSRRLFSESLEEVRRHFQELFRKLFGGGRADIVLEEGADVLDCGIEIVARPPGKEPRSISLLSGGEKTLTCVALLLAIFQYRPSPFCVLDEVDAALDEANIERFIGVLKEFLAWTQFIVVTHSKKTMTCATTLYGVTMQESGVSKRVAVRFEDVSEGGEIVDRGNRAEIDGVENGERSGRRSADGTQAA